MSHLIEGFFPCRALGSTMPSIFPNGHVILPELEILDKEGSNACAKHRTPYAVCAPDVDCSAFANVWEFY